MRSVVFTVALALASTLLGPAPCRAGLILSIQDLTSTSPTLGSFDVVLTNTGGTPIDVSADVLQVDLFGAKGVTFTDATIATASSYIFVMSSFASPGGSLGPMITASTLTVSDAEFESPYYRAVAPGASYGLAHVIFSELPSSPLILGMISIDVGGTSFSDQDGNPITFSVVPEPGSLALMLIGGMILGVLGFARRS